MSGLVVLWAMVAEDSVVNVWGSGAGMVIGRVEEGLMFMDVYVMRNDNE